MDRLDRLKLAREKLQEQRRKRRRTITTRTEEVESDEEKKPQEPPKKKRKTITTEVIEDDFTDEAEKQLALQENKRSEQMKDHIESLPSSIASDALGTFVSYVGPIVGGFLVYTIKTHLAKRLLSVNESTNTNIPNTSGNSVDTGQSKDAEKSVIGDSLALEAANKKEKEVTINEKENTTLYY